MLCGENSKRCMNMGVCFSCAEFAALFDVSDVEFVSSDGLCFLGLDSICFRCIKDEIDFGACVKFIHLQNPQCKFMLAAAVTMNPIYCQ